MDIIKKLSKIFESNLDDHFEDDEDDVVVPQEPDEQVATQPVPVEPEAEVEAEVPAVGPGVGKKKRERTEADDQLRNWYGIPEAQPGKTLDDLKVLDWRNGVTPAKAGWTFDEIVAAMKPSIMDKANYVSNNNPNISKDEAVVAGIEALMHAWKNDAGKSAFPTYAFRWMDTKMRREAANATKMKNVGAQQSYGGQLDWRGLKGQQTHSLDAEDSAGDSFSSNVPAEETATDTTAGRSAALIHKLIDNPKIGLTDVEKMVLRATAGVASNGKKIDPIPSAVIAAKLGNISIARISQIRSKATEKIKEHMLANGMTNLDSAENKLGMHESTVAQALLAIIKESIDLEISINQKYHKVSSDAMIEGKNIGINVIVNADTMEVVDAVDRFDESILAKIPSSSLSEAKKHVVNMTSAGYFADIMNGIIDLHFK